MAGLRYLCVGSGTCVPSVSRGPACHLVEAEGLRILLDLGSGSLRSLTRMGESWARLTAVGVTHRHQDHVGDLLPLLFALRNAPGPERDERLDLFGYAGLSEDLKRLAQVYGRWVLEPGFELAVTDLEPGAELVLGPPQGAVRVRAHRVRHSPEAVGFAIQVGDRAAGGPCRFAYSGDSGPSPALVELAAGADLFVSECAFPDGQGVENHLTPSDLLPICAEAGARRTVATHFYPIWDDVGVERLLAEAIARFGRDVPIQAAHDGLRIEVGESSAG